MTSRLNASGYVPATFTSLRDRTYFFDAGAQFKCMQCGGCCTGEPGRVRFSEPEMLKLSKVLGLPPRATIEKYLVSSDGYYMARELPDGRCIFYISGCIIYPARPRQCRTFPFWLKFLRNEASWGEIADSCPGIGKGTHYTKESVLEKLDWKI